MLTEFIRDNKMNPDNILQIPHTQIESIAGISHGSVVNAIHDLKENNFIRVIEPGGLEGNCTKFQVNKRFVDSGVQTAYW